jgi:RNA polymerase sigma-70 factor, ECF subfamily
MMENAIASGLVMRTHTELAEETVDFDSIVALYRAKIFRFALASLRDPDAAETLTQDCLFKAFQSRHSFRNECSISTWLMQIAVNLIRDHTRNRRLQFWRRTRAFAKPADTLCDFIPDGQRSPESLALLRERVESVWCAAANLPLRQRTVFLLRFVEDMDILEIASVTGLKEGTVKAHLFQALQTVRDQLGTSI